MSRAALQKILLTGVCAALLGGCGLPESGSDFFKGFGRQEADASAPPMNIVRTADATWLEPTGAPPDVTQTGNGGFVAQADRLSRLEELTARMQAQLNGLAAGQAQIQAVLAGMQPAAGLSVAPPAAAAPPPIRQEPSSAPMSSSSAHPQAQQAVLPPASVMQARPASTVSPSPESAWAVPPHREAEAAPAALVTSAPAAAHPAVATAPPVTTVPPVTAAAPPATPPPAATSAVRVQSVRVGEHPGKTRLVLDVSDNVAFRQDLDNNEHILMVELPSTDWAAAPAQQFARSPLIAAYQAMPDGQGGTRLAVQLRKSARIVAAQKLEAEQGRSPRVMIDLAAQ